jgi:flavin reductase (DIM6/NTAB) family NADH-FMN oxidoreductase RutF
MTLPEWPPGTVAILATAGERPHAIPVSTLVRAGPDALLFALGRRRESLRRLREDPRCALAILAPDVAITVHGRATVVADPLEPPGRVAAVRVAVDRVQDHDRPTFAIEGGLPWRWTDEADEAADAAVRAALLALSRRGS